MRRNNDIQGGTERRSCILQNGNRTNMKSQIMGMKIKESRLVCGLVVAILSCTAFFCFTSNVSANGGDMLWGAPFQDVTPGETQEAMASALDSAGNLIVSGYQDVLGNGDEDYYTIKINNAASGDNATLAWSKVYGGSGSGMDWATDVVVDGNDDVIVTGFASNGINDDIVTVKYNGSDGSEEWVHIFDGSSHANDYPNSISIDAAGNIYIAGYSQSGGANSDEAILLKLVPADVALNPSNPPAWVRVVNVTAGGDDRFNDVHAGTSGIAVVGYTTLTDHGGNANDYDYLTAFYSDNGTLVWQESYDNGYGSDEGRYVEIDPSGNVIITGKVLANAGREDIYTLKYPVSGGTPLWSVDYSAGSPNLPQGLVVDANGDVYLCGYTFTNEGLEDFYTVKYDGAVGSVLWDDVYNSGLNNNDSAEALILDNDGGLFVTGFSDKNATDSDFLTLKYNTANGSLLWSDMHDSNEGGNQQTVGVAVGLGVSADGHVYVAGWTQSITNIDDLDYYAIKYDTGFLNRPTGLAISAYTESQVDLSWVDNSYDPDSANPKNEDNFCVQRCTGYACDFSTVDYSDCTSSENSTSFQDGTVAKDTWYSYRVLATNATYGDTHPSNTVAVWTTVIDFPAPTWLYTYDDTSDDSSCLADPSIPTCQLDDMANAISVGSDNNPVVTGLSATVNNQYDYYTVKFDRTDALTPIWVDEYNGSDSQGDMGTCLVVDDNGDVVVSGYSSRDSGTAAGNTNDIYTIKYAATGPDQYTGEPLWAIHYNGPGNDDDRSEAVATASDGSRYVAVVGYGRNTAQTGNDDIYLVKYQPDFAGMGIDQKVWAITPYDSGYNDYPKALMFDPVGDVVVVGKSYNAAGDSDIFINKYSGVDGSQITGQNWPVVIDSGYGDDEIRALIIDKAGNIYVAGFISNNQLNRDWYINKFSVAGNALWTPKTVDGGSDMNDNAIEIALDPNDGDIVIGGTVVNVSGSKDFHIARFAANGTERWQRSVDLTETTEELVGMAMAPSGDATLVGNSCSLGDKCRHGETIPGANPDVMVVRYDHLGDITGSTLYDSGFDDFTTSAVANKLGEVFVAGYEATGPQATDDYDYLVFKSFDTPLQPPSPFSATPHYTTVSLSWTENDTSVGGYRLFRLSGGCTDGGTDFSGALQILGYTDQYNGLTYNDDTGLGSEGQTLCYGIQSHKAGSADSRMIEYEVILNNPVAPDNVTVTAVSSSEIEVCWNDNTSEENYFGVQRCTGAACDFSGSTTTFSAPGMPNDTGLTTCYIDDTACDSGLGQTFRYRINAYNNTGSGWTSAYSLITTEITPPVIGVPTILNASRIAEAEVDLQWFDNSVDEADFIVERCVGAGCDSNYTEVGSVATVSNNVMHLRMDEASWSSGTVNEVSDSSGQNNHATSWDGATINSDSHLGQSGQFDGVDDYLTTSLVLDQSLASPGVTMMAWVKPADVSAGDHYVFSTEDGGIGVENYNWGLLRRGGTWAVANGVNVEDTGISVDSANWQHIVVVFTGSGYNFYLNGSEISRTTIGHHPNGAPLTIGQQGNLSANYFNGFIDEAALYNRPLTSTEILKLYTRGVFPETSGEKWFTDTTNGNTTIDYNTTYNYRIRARKNVSCGTTYSLPSNRIEVVTIPQPPEVTAFVLERGTILLTWVSSTTTQTAFQIDRCNGTGCTPVDLISDTVAAGEIRYADTSACFGSDGVLRYQISALGPWGTSLPSSVAETVIIPDQPISLSVVDATEAKIDLTWSGLDSDRNGYRVLRCIGGAGSCTPVSEVASSPTSYGDAGLLALWQMDQLEWSGAVDEMIDSSGNGYHGTSMNGTKITSSAQFGHGAAEFDGVDDYITTNVPVDQSITSSGFTFEAWVYPLKQMTTNKYHFVMSSSNVNYDYDLGFCFHDNGYWYVDTTKTRYGTNDLVSFDQWQQMVLVFDPVNGVKLYQNGLEIFTNSDLVSEVNSTLTIGREGESNGNYFPGKMDHVAVYSRPLSPSEVLERYNNGSIPQSSVIFTDDDNVTAGTTYTYRVQPVKSTSCGDLDDNAGYLDVTATTDASPMAPDAFMATMKSTTGIDLTWHSNTSSETGFVLERCLGTGCDFSTVTAISVGAGVETYTDLEVCQGNIYNYRIKAVQGSNWQSAYTVSGEVSTPAPQVPLITTIMAISESEVDLAWTDPNFDEESHVVSRCTYDGNATLCDQPGDFLEVFSKDGSLSGLALLYRMDELSWSGIAGEVVDSSSFGNNGQAFGGVSTVVDGRYAGAGNFDGIDDRIITPVDIDQTTQSPGATFEAWVYPTVSDSNWRFVISTGHNNWAIMHVNNFWYVSTGNSWSNTNVPVDIGQWSHIGAVFIPGTGVKFYKNGVETIIPQIAYSVGQNLTIGSRAPSAYYFAGKIDDVLIYKAPLTATEVGGHYAVQAEDYSFADTGLTPDTNYYYKVAAKKDSPTCGWSKEAGDNVTTPVPAAPANFTVTCDTTSCSLAWLDINGSETGYTVNRCDGHLGGSCTVSLDSSLTAGAESFVDETVCPGQNYTYSVYATGSWGTWTQTDYVDSNATAAVLPSVPVLTAQRVSEVEIDLTWGLTPADETGIKLNRCLVGGGCTEIILAPGTISYGDGELVPNSDYTYTVALYKTAATSCNGGWQTDWSNIASASTGAVAINDLFATPLNSTTVDLLWTSDSQTDIDTVVERCIGGAASCQNDVDYIQIGAVSHGVETFTDILNQPLNDCFNREYSYRVKPVGGGLSNDGGGIWSQKAKINFTNFQALSPVILTIDNSTGVYAGIKSDFSDIRFYDETAKRELPVYWIREKSDGISATVWLMTGENDNIFMYFDNTMAVSSDSGSLAFTEIYDDFQGSVIDTDKWVEINPVGEFSQNDGLIITRKNDNWTDAEISSLVFERAVGNELYIDFTLNQHNDRKYLGFAFGWGSDQTVNTAYSTVMYGISVNGYYSNLYFNKLEGGNQAVLAPVVKSSLNTHYEMKIALKDIGAEYYLKGGQLQDWTMVYETNTFHAGDDILRLIILNKNANVTIHSIQLLYASASAGVSFAAPENSTGIFGNEWVALPSNIASTITDDILTPHSLAVTAIADGAVHLVWGDNNTEESSYSIERCCGGGCTYAEIATVAADTFNYADTSYPDNMDCTYQVKAQKSAGNCSWVTPPSPVVAIATPSPSPTGFTAVPVNGFKIELSWDDGVGEEAYELEVQIWNGIWMPVATFTADTTMYTDTSAINPDTSYTYRIRSQKGGVWSAYAEVFVMSNSYVQDDGTCSPNP